MIFIFIDIWLIIDIFLVTSHQWHSNNEVMCVYVCACVCVYLYDFSTRKKTFMHVVANAKIWGLSSPSAHAPFVRRFISSVISSIYLTSFIYYYYFYTFSNRQYILIFLLKRERVYLYTSKYLFFSSTGKKKQKIWKKKFFWYILAATNFSRHFSFCPPKLRAIFSASFLFGAFFFGCVDIFGGKKKFGWKFIDFFFKLL